MELVWTKCRPVGLRGLSDGGMTRTLVGGADSLSSPSSSPQFLFSIQHIQLLQSLFVHCASVKTTKLLLGKGAQNKEVEKYDFFP